MTESIRLFVAPLFATLTLLAGSAGSAQEQSPPEGVVVALPDVFPDIDARAMVIREGEREVVLLRSGDATPHVLEMALRVLRRVRREPLDPTIGEMIPITGFVLRTPLTASRVGRLQAVLDSLIVRPTRQIGRFGPGRWIRFQPR